MDEKSLNDVLECSICFFPMKENARVLPCQHFFCFDCLNQLASRSKELHCPECRQLVNKKVEELPKNVLLIRLLETLKKPNPPPAGSSTTTNPSESQAESTQTKEEVILVPHAKAAFDFSGTAKEHLSFKKGEKILLKKKIDQLWYLGQIHNRSGIFPLKFVSVVIPLPTPQCKALYDFKMGPNDEEGCLTFKKGAIIDVMRRVDLNWAEGRAADKIGIFPLSFVELNPEGHKLMNESMTSGEARAVPAHVVPANPKTPKSNPQTSPNQQQQTTSVQQTPPVTSPVQSAQQKQSVNQQTQPAANVLKPGENMIGVNVIVHPEDPRYRDRFIALYPYKPQKDDELELIKGSHYFITEKCQDGWCKGVSAENPFKSGVFPGNYVMRFITYQTFLARRLAAQNNNNSNSVNKLSSNGPQSLNSNINRHHPAGAGYINLAANPNIFNAPELPPRNSPRSSTASPPAVTPKFKKIEPDSQNVQKDSKSSEKQQRKETVTELFKKQWSKYNRKSQPIDSSSEDIVDGSAYPLDNPVFEDLSPQQQHQKPQKHLNKNLSLGEIKPIHSRSGSCPSQLQQNSLPCDLNSVVASSGGQRNEDNGVTLRQHPQTSSRNHHSTSTSPSNNTIVNKRHSGNLASSPSSFIGGGNNLTTTAQISDNNSKINHRKSNSLDLDALEVTPKSSNHHRAKASQSSDGGSKSGHSNAPRERFRCVANYPPNSRFELELKIGDIIHVHKKRDNGWYKGQNQTTGNVGIFPASFVELDI